MIRTRIPSIVATLGIVGTLLLLQPTPPPGGITDVRGFSAQAAPVTSVPLGSGNWTQLHSVGPTPNLVYPELAYDTRDGYAVLFGYNQSPTWNVTINGWYWSSQTWIYRNGSWANLNLSLQPSARAGEAFAYDVADGYIVLYGGWGKAVRGPTGCVHPNSTWYRGCDDTWIFHGGSWVLLNPLHVPPARADPEFGYFPPDHAMLMGGGFPLRTNSNVSGQWWAFRAGNWTRFTLKTGSSSPWCPPCSTAGMAYDPALGHMVAASTRSSQADVYFLSHRNWTLNGTSGRFLGVMTPGELVYDPELGTLVVVGGDNPNGTFELNSSTLTWLQVNRSSGPNSRSLDAVTFDAADHALLMYGGQSTITSSFEYDSWEFS